MKHLEQASWYFNLPSDVCVKHIWDAAKFIYELEIYNSLAEPTSVINI